MYQCFREGWILIFDQNSETKNILNPIKKKQRILKRKEYEKY